MAEYKSLRILDLDRMQIVRYEYEGHCIWHYIDKITKESVGTITSKERFTIPQEESDEQFGAMAAMLIELIKNKLL